MRSGLADSYEWEPDCFGDGVDIDAEARPAVGATFERGQTKLRDYAVIPKLFASLRKPGVKTEILIQWNEIPPSKHPNAQTIVPIRVEQHRVQYQA